MRFIIDGWLPLQHGMDGLEQRFELFAGFSINRKPVECDRTEAVPGKLRQLDEHNGVHRNHLGCNANTMPVSGLERLERRWFLCASGAKQWAVL